MCLWVYMCMHWDRKKIAAVHIFRNRNREKYLLVKETNNFYPVVKSTYVCSVATMATLARSMLTS